ncbi:MAG TPA: hypothetical protein PK176_16190 [Acidobacteriota bacterium]|nr:hypothetical protein [Acidobacteriota bacterium]HQM64854.1 hypothetical protein [Acidobacteriota bacterium]
MIRYLASIGILAALAMAVTALTIFSLGGPAAGAEPAGFLFAEASAPQSVTGDPVVAGGRRREGLAGRQNRHYPRAGVGDRIL